MFRVRVILADLLRGRQGSRLLPPAQSTIETSNTFPVFKISQKFRCGLGSAPDPTGELAALLTPLSWIVEAASWRGRVGGAEKRG